MTFRPRRRCLTARPAPHARACCGAMPREEHQHDGRDAHTGIRPMFPSHCRLVRKISDRCGLLRRTRIVGRQIEVDPSASRALNARRLSGRWGTTSYQPEPWPHRSIRRPRGPARRLARGLHSLVATIENLPWGTASPSAPAVRAASWVLRSVTLSRSHPASMSAGASPTARRRLRFDISQSEKSWEMRRTRSGRRRQDRQQISRSGSRTSRRSSRTMRSSSIS
jgi:hypothetical protein